MAGIENTAAYDEKGKSRPGESSRPAFCTNSSGKVPAREVGKVPVKGTDTVMTEEPAADRCRLSVIVPVFNMASEDRLSFCVNSLLQQTISDYEILAVDDGSKDHSAKILREYEEKYPGIVKLINKENGGHGDAVNAGLSHASGKYFKVVGLEVYPMNSDEYAYLHKCGADYPALILISSFPSPRAGPHTLPRCGSARRWRSSR